jgi:hypothetical protein
MAGGRVAVALAGLFPAVSISEENRLKLVALLRLSNVARLALASRAL